MKTPPSPSRPRALSRSALGRLGEELACRALVEHGYEIIARNWRCPAGEVDIIACEDGCLAFVEVKTRLPGGGLPEEGLTQQKAQRIIAVAQHYLGQNATEEPPWRLDLVAVELGADGQPRRIAITPAIGMDA